MPAPTQNVDVLVIGAGMAGLTAAAELQTAGRSVVVLDKGWAVGGRMAIRRIGAATFAHGAQFITARDPRFAAVLDQERQAGVVEEWCRGFAGRADGHPRWRGNPTMTAFTKHLARGLEARKQVVTLQRGAGRWRAETKSSHSPTPVRVLTVHGAAGASKFEADRKRNLQLNLPSITLRAC